MKPAPFAYAKARSVEDAVKLLGEHGEGARLLAGGQSLMATLWPEGARLVIYLGMAGNIMAMPRGLFGRS